MNGKIQTKMDEVIYDNLEKIGDSSMSEEEKKKVIDNLSELHKMRIEEEKMKQAKDNAIKEQESKREQLKGQFINTLITSGVTILTAVGGWKMYSVWQRREQHFELHGTPANAMFRNLLSKMTPNLKR